MTDYSKLKTLFTDYDCLANQERGYNGGAVSAALGAVGDEYRRLGIPDIGEARRLAFGYRPTKPVQVEGPAYVLHGSRQIIICETAEGMKSADPGNKFCQMSIPAGQSHTFSVQA